MLRRRMKRKREGKTKYLLLKNNDHLLLLSRHPEDHRRNTMTGKAVIIGLSVPDDQDHLDDNQYSTMKQMHFARC